MNTNEKAAATYHPGAGPDPRIYGHGSITLTSYPSSGRVAVETRGTNPVMDTRELINFVESIDREQGIHRVKVDDATVERVMDALVMTRMGDYNIEIWEFRNAARAVLAALTGGES